MPNDQPRFERCGPSAICRATIRVPVGSSSSGAGRVVWTRFHLSLEAGFLGGTVFPMLFMGGTAGLFVYEILPGVPTALAVAGMIATLPGAIIGAPVSFVLIGVVGVGIGVESLAGWATHFPVPGRPHPHRETACEQPRPPPRPVERRTRTPRHRVQAAASRRAGRPTSAPTGAARSAREVSRTAWSGWAAAADRPDPVALLLSQSAARVPDLVPIRHGRMLVGPFTFYRGAALVMAADLRALPSSGIYVQACGDAHLSNFGTFATPERTMAFDINDFDETHPAPFEWDVARLAASIVVAADDIGFDRKTGQALAAARDASLPRAGARHSRRRRSSTSGTRSVDFEGRVREAPRDLQQGRAEAAAKAARRPSARRTSARSTGSPSGSTAVAHQGRSALHRPRRQRTRARASAWRGSSSEYVESLPRDLLPLVRHYELVDFARKVVGVGSVGTEAHIALLIGTRGDDALFLQLKEADRLRARALHGQRPVRAPGRTCRLRPAPDAGLERHLPGLGQRRPGRREHVDFYVRQLNDYKASADVVGMTERRLSTTSRSVPRPWRVRTLAPAAPAPSRLPGQGRAAFDRAMGSLRRAPTPTRTDRTTRPSPRPPRTGGWRSARRSEPGLVVVRFERCRPFGVAIEARCVPYPRTNSSGCSAEVAHMLWEPFRLERRRLRGHERGARAAKASIMVRFASVACQQSPPRGPSGRSRRMGPVVVFTPTAGQVRCSSRSVTRRRRDGLAAIRIRAPGGIQRLGAGDEPLRRGLGLLGGFESPVDILEVPLHELDAWWQVGSPCRAQLEDRGHLRERETTVLRVTDEAEAFDGLRSVVAIPVRRPHRWRHEPDVLVVADGRSGQPGLVRDVAEVFIRR